MFNNIHVFLNQKISFVYFDSQSLKIFEYDYPFISQFFKMKINAFILLSFIIICLCINVVVFRALLHQSNPSLVNAKLVLINKTFNNISIVNKTAGCNDTLDCLYVMNSLGTSDNFVSYIKDVHKNETTQSIFIAMSQEWQSCVLFQLFSVFLFLDITIIVVCLIFQCSGVIKHLEDSSKTVIFGLTIALLITGVVIHQDDPFGPMINVICGIFVICAYCYLTFFHVEISYRKIKVREYSVI